MTLDLPFYTEGGKQYSTTKSNNMKASALTLDQESCRPQVVVQPQCVSTVLYVRSRDRQPSDMKGTTTRFDRIDDMATTNSSFGTGYKLSDKTKKFDHSNPLISSRTDASSGYVALDDRYARLVIEIKKVSSTMNYSSAKTTLTYINAAGKMSSHDYGDLDLGSRENIKLVFDLSPNTLADGCKGLLSLTNNNWSSTLTLNLGNVTLENADPAAYAATLSGAYVADDSYVQEYGGDVHCVSLDLTQVTGLPASLAWVSGKNRIIYLAEDAPVDGSNLVKGEACESLELATGSVFGFRPLRPFTAKAITLETDMGWGARLIMLPFAASVPDGVKAYTVNENLELSPITAIPAHTPVLVEGSGTVVFSGEGEVTFAKSPVDQMLRGVYTSTLLSSNDYILVRENGKLGFRRVEAEPATITASDVYARLNTEERFVPLQHVGAGIVTATADDETDITTFDLLGRRMTATPLKPGLYIRNGKKYIK
jgi:glucuronoarabinoxylan endo-1,4-beta-xylanase